MLKYAEGLGVDALVITASHDRTMSYDQKARVIEHIIKTEGALRVQDSSWKHCLLFMLMGGTISEEQFRNQFDFAEKKSEQQKKAVK